MGNSILGDLSSSEDISYFHRPWSDNTMVVIECFCFRQVEPESDTGHKLGEYIVLYYAMTL